MRSHIGQVSYFAVLLLTAYFVGCGDENKEDTGTLLVRLSDSPFPIELVLQANVDISRIEARGDGSQSGQQFITLSEDVRTYNLLDLRNGVTADLAEVEVPVGSYNLLRLYVSEAAITLIDSTVFDLQVPSDAQTGIKIFVEPPIQVEGGLTSELLLDFDVNQSFVVQGNPDTPAGITGFIFKPVIRAVNVSSVGRISGSVTDNASVGLADAYVWLEQDSVVANTFTDSTGNYALLGIPEGTYTVSATKTAYDTVAVSAVEVVAGNETVVNLTLTPE